MVKISRCIRHKFPVYFRVHWLLLISLNIRCTKIISQILKINTCILIIDKRNDWIYSVSSWQVDTGSTISGGIRLGYYIGLNVTVTHNFILSIHTCSLTLCLSNNNNLCLKFKKILKETITCINNARDLQIRMMTSDLFLIWHTFAFGVDLNVTTLKALLFSIKIQLWP